jgi:hypothetical protein
MLMAPKPRCVSDDVMVLRRNEDPGEPKMTMPPSVAPVI